MYSLETEKAQQSTTPQLNERIVPPVPLGVDIEDEMRWSYVNYSLLLN